MRATRLARLWLVVLAAAIPLVSSAAPARAQPDWPSLVAQLGSDDPEQVKAARTALVTRLTDIALSVADRTADAAQILPGLREHVAAGGARAIQGIIVAGDVATDGSADVLESVLDDPAGDVRYAAVFALGRTFERLGTSPPAINNARAQRMISRLGEGLSKETQAEVVDAYVRSLIRASRVAQAGVGDLRQPALRTLARAMSARITTLKRTPDDDPFMIAMVRAAEEVRDAIVGDALQRQLAPDVVCEAAALAGDMFAYLYQRLRSGERGGWAAITPQDDEAARSAKTAVRRTAFTIAQLAEATVIYIRDRLQVGEIKQFGLGSMIQDADAAADRRFLDVNTGVLQVIGATGLLSKFPCQFAPERFLRGG